jgi:hypothetical protein
MDMETGTDSIIAELLSNFNPKNEIDHFNHERVMSALGTREHINALKILAAAIKVSELCSPEKLKEMYIRIFKELLESRIQLAELKALVLSLSGMLLTDGEDQAAEVSQLETFFSKFGITPQHQFFDD